jgi:hypothetical protein
VKVEVSRFNASIFEILHPNKKDRAFLRREDPEFLDALQAEASHASRAKKMPLGLARLLPEPTIEITDERWNKLRARISGSFPAVKLD